VQRSYRYLCGGATPALSLYILYLFFYNNRTLVRVENAHTCWLWRSTGWKAWKLHTHQALGATVELNSHTECLLPESLFGAIERPRNLARQAFASALKSVLNIAVPD
jgi:hypothetical protein